MRYDIFNPTTAPRVIYDGIDRGGSDTFGLAQQRKITVLPGETKKDVELADHIAAGFHYAPTDEVGDLVLAPLGQEPLHNRPAALKALPADYVPYQAPPIENAALELCADPAALLSANRPKRGRPRKTQDAPTGD